MESFPNTYLRLRLLGSFEFQCAERVVRLESLKTSALLAYLALQVDPQPRHKLMGLLWGDLPEAKARRNLRHALWNLRSQFDSAGRPTFFSSDQHTIQFNRTAYVWLDVAEFEQCFRLQESLAGEAQTAQKCLLLRQALELYRGDLLEGFYIDGAVAFEEWLLIERERLRMLAIAALQQMIAHDLAWGEYAEGLEYARRLLAMEPWHEEAHRLMMRLLMLSGQRSAALAQYETCRRTLAEELGAEPSAETQALFESIQASQQPGQVILTPPRRNLPAQTTPFIGREQELARIAAYLHHPECRLLTLVGPGGIGKTRLALRAAANTNHFVDGVFFVPLVSITTSELLIPAIADAIGFTFRSGENALAQLLAYLGEKDMLLVLDNFEPLVDSAGLVAELLLGAEHLKILVTSRERLNLNAEWLFEVEGLDCPPDELAAGSQPGLVESCSAVKLFVQSAQRARLGFVLSPEDQASVARFCRMVAGMPLAIELAAAWTRALTCQEIVHEVERNFDFLTASQRDVPMRHRSMRAVCDQSWKLLGEAERAVFKRLTVFRSGFHRQASEAVAGATPQILVTLVDKCFLHHIPSGRYEIHELLRRYGEEQMSADEIQQARDLHSHYFANFLYQCHEQMRSGPEGKPLDEISREIDNVRAAWHWMAQNQNADALKRSCTSLFRLCETRLHLQDGVTMFNEASQAMRQAPPLPENRLVLATLLRLQARLLSMLGDQETARGLLSESLEIVRKLGDKKEEAFVLNNLGILAKTTGEYVQALQYYQESLAIKRELGEPVAIVNTLVNLVQVMFILGDYGKAIELNREAQSLAQALGAKDLIASIRYFEGEIALGMNNLDEAQAHYKVALELYRELAKSWAIANCFNGLACVELDKNGYKSARQFAEEGLNYAQQVGDAGSISFSLFLLGQITEAQGDFNEAERFYRQAMQTALTTKQLPLVLVCLIGVASLQAHAGQIEPALELLSGVIEHPATTALDCARAMRLRTKLENQLTQETATTRASKKPLNFEEAALAWLNYIHDSLSPGY